MAEEATTWHLTGRRLLCFGAIALLAGGLVLLATRHGVSTSADSAVYLGTARNVEAGHGLDVPIHFYPLGSADIGTPPLGHFAPQPTPLIHYAPLIPVLLSIGGHPLGAARVEAALFFALTVLVVGLLVLAVTDELWLSAVAQLVVAGSVAVEIADLGVNAFTLFPTVVALAAVVVHRRRPWSGWLIVASLAIGLATLEWYATGGLIVWGILALRHRRRDALALLVMSSLPLGAWFAYEEVSGRGTGHPVAFHVVTSTLHAGLRSVSYWILPSNVSKLALLGAPAVVIIVFLVVRRHPTPAVRLLVLFAVVQIVILEVATTFFDAAVNLDPFELFSVLVALNYGHGVCD